MAPRTQQHVGRRRRPRRGPQRPPGGRAGAAGGGDAGGGLGDDPAAHPGVVPAGQPGAAVHLQEVGARRLEQAQREQEVPVQQGQGGRQGVSIRSTEDLYNIHV